MSGSDAGDGWAVAGHLGSNSGAEMKPFSCFAVCSMRDTSAMSHLPFLMPMLSEWTDGRSSRPGSPLFATSGGKKHSSHCICGLPANTLKSELMGRCYYASPVPVATAVGLKKHCNGLCD